MAVERKAMVGKKRKTHKLKKQVLNLMSPV